MTITKIALDGTVTIVNEDAPSFATLAPVDPLTIPLPRLEFWLVAAQANVSKWSIRDRIAAMEEGPEKFEAIAWFEDADRYRREDPILNEMAPAEGITPEQLDALWIWGLQTYGLLPAMS